MSNFQLSVLCLAITLVLYFANKRLYRRFRKLPLMPLVLTPVLLVLMLVFGHISYQNYMGEAHWLLWLLGPATIAFAVPVYDNLERALAQQTVDEAFKKGVEMTMTQLLEIFEKMGVKEIPALGEKFDPEKHNAVMHIEDENFGENVIAEEFQKGFMLGDKVIRFSMVKVAN